MPQLPIQQVSGKGLAKVCRRLTNDEFRSVHFLIPRCMVLGGRQHVHYSATRALLTKLHLQNRPVDRLSRNLVGEHVELSVRYFEVSR